MKTSRDKQVKSQMRRSEYGLEMKTLKGETEYLLMPAQNNAIRTKYVNVKRVKTPKNSRCRFELRVGFRTVANLIFSALVEFLFSQRN